MSLSRFGGMYNAIQYAYGILGSAGPGPLQVGIGVPAGVGTVTLNWGQSALGDGTILIPLNVNAPITIGTGANAETVTPSAVSNNTPTVYQSTTVTATFANAHGIGDNVSSGSIGLQEAINFASSMGGGTVLVNAGWYQMGGTLAIIQAAVLPTNGTVKVLDTTTFITYAQAPSSVSVIAAPSALTSSLIGSLTGVAGSWTAGTLHAVCTYVTADGGETLSSADYSFTTTVSLSVGGSGPAAATGAVGYRVYLSLVGSAVDYLVPVIAANGTVIQCGPIAAFKIGTPFSVAAVTVNTAAVIPVQSNAFGVVKPMPFASSGGQVKTVSGPFAVTGVVTAGTAIEWGKAQLPTAFLNQIGRTLRITLHGYYTPVSTATLIITVAIQSIYGQTTTTVFTVTTPASSGTTAANINGVIDICVAAVGAAGTVECHGTILYGGATATAGLLVAAGDSVQTVSSAIDLTAQDVIVVSINSGAANITQSQLRRMIIEVLE